MSETHPMPEMDASDVPSTTLPPTSTDSPSDLLSNTVPPPPASAQDLPNTIGPESTSEALDPQPAASNPVAPSESGISSVAQFLPSDANMNHKTPEPSELLDSNATTAPTNTDTTMTDVSADMAPVAQPVVQTEPPSAIDAAPVANGVDAPNDVATTTQQSTTATATEPFPDLTSPAVPTEQATSAMTQDTPAQSIETPAAVPDVPVISTDSAVDQPMQDAPTASLIRSRENDEDTDEPSAKRARTAETGNEEAEFKKPDLPAAVPAAAPPATNGTSAHLPQRKAFSNAPLTVAQRKIVEDKLKNTKKVKAAIAFLAPVDPVALKIPSYPEIVRSPMDLGTIEQKIKRDEYKSLDDIVNDFDLMVNNCFLFNGPAHVVSIQAQNLRAYFMKQMETVPTGAAAAVPPPRAAPRKASPKPMPRRESRAVPGAAAPTTPAAANNDSYALMPGGLPQIRRDSTAERPKRTIVPPPSRDLPYSGVKPKRKENQVGLKFCKHVLEEFKKPKNDNITFVFNTPVDPVALNIPNYFKVIKKPMDISTITNKLTGGQYSTAEEFKADFDLMINNCLTFNPTGNPVHNIAKSMQAKFEEYWSEKKAWVKKNQAPSQRATPNSEVDSEDEESDEEEEDAETDSNEKTIAMLREQLANMQNMVAAIAGPKRQSPKAAGKKKNRTSGGATKIKKAAVAAKPAAKAKPKKQRMISYEEKQEISNATENMSEAQIQELTSIITNNVAKYKNMSGDDVELEIDDLPNEVQHMLLKYVRSIFPRQRASPDEEPAVDDDYYEPERNARSGGTKKKHKPMKKHEQESRIAQLKQTMASIEGNITDATATGHAPARPVKDESSDDDDSESSEEE